MTKILISPVETKALLFDLDGTIINNMDYHDLAWQQTLKELGYDWTLAEVKARIWGKNEESFKRNFPGRFSDSEIKELARQKEEAYIKSYRPYITMISGLEVFLENIKSVGMKLALVSAAPRMNVDFSVEALKLDRYFESIVHADQVTYSKPHPEPYLTAARALNTEPKHCLVFEDAPVGVKSAEAATMESYVILTTHKREEFDSFKSIRSFIIDYTSFEIG